MQKLKIQIHDERATARNMINFCGCVLLMLAALAGASYAQAGRRVQTPKKDPPVPRATGVEAPVKEPTPEPEKISLLVVSSRSSAMRYTVGLADTLPGVVGRRLQDSRRLEVASGGEMSRGEANKRAKEKETKTFVVWFELEGQGFDMDPMNRRTRIEDLSVRYVVLEPGTGKLKDQGVVHLRPVSSVLGVRRLPSCYPQVSSNFEFALMVAGIETAERIFRSFALPNPPICS